jgi:hypothetical protein
VRLAHVVSHVTRNRPTSIQRFCSELWTTHFLVLRSLLLLNAVVFGFTLSGTFSIMTRTVYSTSWNKDYNQYITIKIWIHLHLPVWWPEDKNIPNVAHACRKRRLKWVPSAWGIVGHSVSGGHKYGGQVLQVGGWAWDWQPHPIKILFSGNPRKSMTHKRLSCQRWWRDGVAQSV